MVGVGQVSSEAPSESVMVHPIEVTHPPQQATPQAAEAAAEVAAAERAPLAEPHSEHRSKHNPGMDSEVLWVCYCG